MLKKINVFIVMWLFVSVLQCSGETTPLRYEIRYDSMCNEELKIKEEIFDVYTSIIYGVDQDSRPSLVLKNLDLFKLDDRFQVSHVQDLIIITMGDGNGTLITGEFDWVMCSNTVKPKSWLQEVLGF